MYTVKTNTGKHYDCKAYSLTMLDPNSHELIMEGFTGEGVAGSRKLISVSNKPRQGTDPERCTSVGVYNQEGELVTSAHADGSAVGTEVPEVEAASAETEHHEEENP